jgi:prolyl-tRNA editing enzyme YbaK/EbsC (Cys-tRNA(Pro) deacylase)
MPMLFVRQLVFRSVACLPLVTAHNYVLQYDEVWAAAGTWNDVFGAAPADIVRVSGGVVTDLKRT